MFGWFKKKRSLNVLVNPRRKVKVCECEFIIKKIDVLDHAQGLQVLQQHFDTYQNAAKQGKELTQSTKKIKEHYVDVILAGVVSPKITRKPTDGLICVTDMFNNFELLEGLYSEIMEFSYSKKKI